MKRCALLLLALTGCPAPADPIAPPPPAPVAAPSAVAKAPAGPPLAKREPVTDVVHGVTIQDPYRWLEDGDAPEVKAFLAAHQEHTRAELDAVPERAALEARLRELRYIETVSSPRRRGTRYFFQRRPKDQEKTIYFWREGEAGEPKVLIDPNTMSDDGSVSVRGVSVAWNGELVAYKVAENNADEATMRVMRVADGEELEGDRIEGAKYAHASWEPGGRGFYYISLPVDDSIPVDERPGYAEARYHRIGTDPADDPVVFPKTGDPRVFLDVELSRDGRYLFLYKYFGWTKVDVLFKDLRRDREFRPLAVGLDAKFAVEAHGGRFYLRTNLDAPRYRLFLVDPKRVAREQWKEIVPERERAVLEGAQVLGGKLVLRYLDKASGRLEVADLQGKVERVVKLPGIGSVYGPQGNPEDDVAYYGFASYDRPTTIYRTNLRTGETSTYFELDVPVDPSPYQVEQVAYPSKDGTEITMFVIRRRDMPLDGTAPLLLRGYGGFNINQTPAFVPSWYAWLERGGAIAVPNLRGGGEYGEGWHRAGMREKKQNVFDDFVGAAEWLIEHRYTRADKLAIMGGSNGGLLVGAAMVQRPALFGAVVCAVPLLDMVRYHRFGSGRTWISEYGSAEDPEQFRYLHAYSPYHHVKEGTAYPALLMLTADSDDRVDPLHARKFLAAVRHASSSGEAALLRVESNAGHGGGDMVDKHVQRDADVYAFLLRELRGDDVRP